MRMGLGVSKKTPEQIHEGRYRKISQVKLTYSEHVAIPTDNKRFTLDITDFKHDTHDEENEFETSNTVENNERREEKCSCRTERYRHVSQVKLTYYKALQSPDESQDQQFTFDFTNFKDGEEDGSTEGSLKESSTEKDRPCTAEDRCQANNGDKESHEPSYRKISQVHLTYKKPEHLDDIEDHEFTLHVTNFQDAEKGETTSALKEEDIEAKECQSEQRSVTTDHDHASKPRTTSDKRRRISQVKLTHYEGIETSTGKRFTIDFSDIIEPEDKAEHKAHKRKHTMIGFNNVSVEVYKSSKDIATYCLPLLTATFAGQTSSNIHTDEVDGAENGTLHLGVYLSLIDAFLRTFENVKQFTGTEEYYLKLLSYVAAKRKAPTECEEQAYQRILEESRRFVKIYHKRGILSQELPEHKDYWGSRQQLLSGRVIADWVDKDNGALDPIFGVLLQPTSGRAGPGDSGWFHEMIFDETGHVAYHSAVHDAFGYLLNYHNIGPGYDYMDHSYLSKSNPLAGQFDGMHFWKKALHTIGLKQVVASLGTSTMGVFQWNPESEHGCNKPQER